MSELLLVDLRDAGPVLDGYPRCRCCGCWEYDPCDDEFFGACWWVDQELCSRCATPRE